MLNLNEENFENEVLNSKEPVIVDFWASWCPPCRMLGPIFEETSKDFQNKVKFAKLSTEEQPDLATKYSVMSIPTMIIFKDGKEVGRLVGVMQKEQLSQEINKII